MIKCLPLDFLGVSHRILLKNENAADRLQVAALVRTLLLPLKNIFHTISVSCQTLLEPEITPFLGFSTLQLKIHTAVILHCLLAITCFPTDASDKLQFVWKSDNTFDPAL